MRHVRSAMPAFLRVSIANMLQYRAEITLWALWGIVSPAVLMAVWGAAASASSTPGSIAGRTVGQITAYFLMNMIVGHLAAAWDVYQMGWQVRTGRLSAKLLRPILPVWESLSDNLAYKIVTLVMLVPSWTIIGLVVRPALHPSGLDLLIGLVAVPMAALLNFLWGYVFSVLAFYVTKLDAASELYFGVSMFLGGRIAPIGFLPDLLRFLAWFSPFQWVFAYPSELLAGQLSPQAALAGLGWQLGWFVTGVLVFRFVWPRALMRYSAVGA